VRYTDALQTAKQLYNDIKDSVDAVVAITHQSIDEDKELAKEIPGLATIIGGHEHDQRFEKVGNIYITKALANAKSAYVVHLNINKKKHNLKVVPELRYLNEQVAFDSATNVVVQKWNDIANSNYSSLGFDAQKVVIKESEPLDGRETEIRSHPTNLTRLAIVGMKYVVPTADVMLLNAGSIRVDDILHAPVTEYDIIRSLPFGGSIREADMKGSLLMQVLDQGEKNVNIGGYLLHNDSLTHAGDKWILNQAEIDSSKIYHVAIGEFLLTGKEANLDFLNPSNPGIVKVYDPAPQGDPRSDIRLAIVKYLNDMPSSH
jgi:2',3'-cyclic-nucleotide 2'-phosphodiesterase (5'-nucleotidase family)